MRSLVLFATVLLGLLACSKPSEPGPAPAASSAAPIVSAPAVSAAPIVSAAPVVSAAPAVSATTAMATASDAGSDAGLACGKRPLPDCPLQAWMKENANSPVMAGDTARIAVALDKMVALAPPGNAYPNWVSIAKDGAAAARGGDLAAAKASCRGCHDQYKSKYRTEMRARKI